MIQITKLMGLIFLYRKILSAFKIIDFSEGSILIWISNITEYTDTEKTLSEWMIDGGFGYK